MSLLIIAFMAVVGSIEMGSPGGGVGGERELRLAFVPWDGVPEEFPATELDLESFDTLSSVGAHKASVVVGLVAILLANPSWRAA